VSLGLLIPWAQIRLARYRASAFELQASADLDAFAAAEAKQVVAYGQEFTDFFQFDLAV
jgi:uncharacterized membrane protein YjgN (DUF898 family)